MPEPFFVPSTRDRSVDPQVWRLAEFMTDPSAYDVISQALLCCRSDVEFEDFVTRWASTRPNLTDDQWRAIAELSNFLGTHHVEGRTVDPATRRGEVLERFLLRLLEKSGEYPRLGTRAHVHLESWQSRREVDVYALNLDQSKAELYQCKVNLHASLRHAQSIEELKDYQQDGAEVRRRLPSMRILIAIATLQSADEVTERLDEALGSGWRRVLVVLGSEQLHPDAFRRRWLSHRLW